MKKISFYPFGYSFFNTQFFYKSVKSLLLINYNQYNNNNNTITWTDNNNNNRKDKKIERYKVTFFKFSKFQ